jgi:hypothetical protein
MPRTARQPRPHHRTGPPPEITIVQSLLYAGLATPLFAAFLAMLGKQWVLTFTLFGVASYAFLALAATLYYDCRDQTISSPIFFRYLKHSQGCPLAENLFTYLSSSSGEGEHTPLAVVLEPPVRIFGDVSIDWEDCQSDARRMGHQRPRKPYHPVSWQTSSSTVFQTDGRFPAGLNTPVRSGWPTPHGTRGQGP